MGNWTVDTIRRLVTRIHGVDRFNDFKQALNAIGDVAMSRTNDGELLFPEFTFGEAMDLARDMS